MKKTLCMLVHILAILAVVAGLITLHGYSADGEGFGWINNRSFEDSVLFSEMVSSDIGSLKRYAVLKNAFEEEADGELSYNKIVVGATTSNGYMYYKLSDLIEHAADYGYTMDDDTHSVTYNDRNNQRGTLESPYILKVSYMAFDPFYFDNTTFGPTQGLTNIRDLSVEAVKALSEYYKLDAVYGTDKTNFVYSAVFDSGDGYPVEMGNTTLSIDNIRLLPRYLRVTDEGNVETNIVPQPEGVLSTRNSFDYMWDEGDVLAIGIDTSYIYNDRYRQASLEFERDVNRVLIWLFIMGISAFFGVVSLVFVVRGFNKEDNTELTMDRIPLEALIFIAAAVSIILYILFKLTVNVAFEALFDAGEWEFIRDISKAVVVWLCCVPILQSMYRRELNGGCFKNSLAAGLFRYLAGDDDSSAVWEALKGYAAFIIVHFTAAVFIFWCWNRRYEAPNYIIALVLSSCVLAAFDVFIYVLRYREARQKHIIKAAIGKISDGDTEVQVDESEFTGSMLDTAKKLNNISAGLDEAVREQVKADRLKADLITNVSHDIRTPLTSIINYVDLIKREHVEDERIQEYIDVLDKKSARLKKLTDDLLEASKASSGNIKLDMQCIDMVELAGQAGGEFEDKFAQRRLELNLSVPDHSVFVMADGRYLWRVFENLYNNAAKYSLEGTRIYAEVKEQSGKVKFTIKNISASKLNISPDELTERFVRGDVSRSTEGSGLGLNIAESLTRLMGGELVLEIDGDLYKANVIMDRADVYTEYK